MAQKGERVRSRVLLQVYVGLVVSLAIVVGVAILSHWGRPDGSQVAFFWSINVIALYLGRVEVRIARLAIVEGDKPRVVFLSPSFAILLTAAFATRPSTAFFIAFIPAIPELSRHDERGLVRLVFNASQEAIYVGTAAVVFAQLNAIDGLLGAFIAASIAAVIALTINTLTVAGAVAMDQGVTLNEVLRRMTWTIPHSFGFGLIALIIGRLYVEFGPASAIFLFMPLAALRCVRQARVELDEARNSTILGFVRAVDAKDPYTYQHSERVATIVVALHRELGASRATLERRWSAALLHDIGKIAVPSEVLSKPGPLNSMEFDLVKRHPGLGADAVSRIDLLKEVAPEIRYHHERLDGLGYPEGLSGDSIPFDARVLAVADAFEALTSNRPYRAARTEDEALRLITETAGQHHDPAIVETLKHVIAHGLVLIPRRTQPGQSEVVAGLQ